VVLADRGGWHEAETDELEDEVSMATTTGAEPAEASFAGGSSGASEPPAEGGGRTVESTDEASEAGTGTLAPEAPAEEAERAAPRAATPRPKKTSGPSDKTLVSRLKRKIDRACGVRSSGERVTVSFLVGTDGGIGMLSVDASKTMTKCVKDEARARKFPARSKERVVKFVME
jgi:hypothetical protein